MGKMAKDADLRKSMGLAAKETVSKFYNADETWKVWLKAFEETAERKLNTKSVALGVA